MFDDHFRGGIHTIDVMVFKPIADLAGSERPGAVRHEFLLALTFGYWVRFKVLSASRDLMSE